jgi:hypothetical protein
VSSLTLVLRRLVAPSAVALSSAVLSPAMLLTGTLAAPAHTAAMEAPAPPYAEAVLPHYLVRRAVSPITVDGDLSEFAWASVPQIDGFQRILNDYGRVLHATRARMVWDDEALYLAFACRDPEMWALYTQEDDPMWSEEVVEAFIDPDGDGRDYLEVEVNPLNAVVDLHIGSISPEWVSDRDWDIAGLRTAVAVHGTVNDSTDTDVGWTVEIAIPWSAFEPTIVGGARPQVGDRWRLNLYRIERVAGQGARARLRDLGERLAPLQQALAALPEGPSARRADLETQIAQLQAEIEPLQDSYHDATEYTAWSPTFQRGFHHPARFGVVEFAP